MAERLHISLWALLAVLVTLHVLTWSSVRDTRGRWANVPPASGETGAAAFALGDRETAYRAAGLMLQNLGNTGGRTEPLKNYDYGRLRDWFLLTWKLDPRSNFIPYLAAYYFGAVEDPEKLKAVVDYLQVAGTGPESRSWRWLAHAVYLARYKVKDLDRAYDLANLLASSPDKTLPVWAKQMPAFILEARGDKEAAYDILVEILKTSADTLPAAEVNFMTNYICTRILDAAQALAHPLCRKTP